MRGVRARSVLALVAWLGACPRDPGPHDPADYDQHCATDADCVLVFPRACPCTCHCDAPLGAVNLADLARFDDDESARPCPPRHPLAGCAMCDCVDHAMVAACDGATCRAVTRDAGW